LSASAEADGLDSTYPDDPRLWQGGGSTQVSGPVAVALQQISALSNVVVGELTVDFTGASPGLAANDSISCGNKLRQIGLLVAESMLDWCTDGDIAHINAGGLRADLTHSGLAHSPDITRGDILKVLPFGNTLVSYNIEAKDFLREVIEASVHNRASFAFQQF